jgi:hypothetical protein
MDYSKNQGIISHPTPVAKSPAKPLFFYLLIVVGVKFYPKPKTQERCAAHLLQPKIESRNTHAR